MTARTGDQPARGQWVENLEHPGRRLGADAWGSRYVEIGDFGHINGNGGLGDWAQGKAWLNQLLDN